LILHIIKDTSLSLAAQSNIRFILNLGVRAVEVLCEVVIEDCGLSAVLAHDGDKVTNLFGLNNFVVAVYHIRLCAHARHSLMTYSRDWAAYFADLIEKGYFASY